MADIKQAAKWLDQRKNVARKTDKGSGYFYTSPGKFILWQSKVKHPEYESELHDMLEVDDLLADDWEISE